MNTITSPTEPDPDDPDGSLPFLKKVGAYLGHSRRVPETLDPFGRYSHLRLIGQGGMGAVYEGFDAELNRVVAVKVLHNDLAARPEERLRFEQESRGLAKLQHPNVPAVHDRGTIPVPDGPPYFVMQLVRGSNLAEYRAELPSPHSADALRRLLDVFAGVSRAVAHAHAPTVGVVHRDLKPKNVMLDQMTGVPLVVDWGLNESLARGKSTRSGTPAYMAPEVAGGGEADEQVDVFGLGGLLAFILTGRAVYEGGDEAAVRAMAEGCDTTACFARLDACGHPEMAKLASSCLAKVPTDRPKAAKVLEVLEEHFAAEAVAAEREKVTAAELAATQVVAREGTRRRRMLTGFGAAVAVLVGVAVAAAGYGVWKDGEKRLADERAKQETAAADLRAAKALADQARAEKDAAVRVGEVYLQAAHDATVAEARALVRRGDWPAAMRAYRGAIADARPDERRLRVEYLPGFFATNDPAGLEQELATHFLDDAGEPRADLGEFTAAVCLAKGAFLLCDSDRQDDGRAWVKRALAHRHDLSLADAAYADALVETRPRLVVDGLRRAVELDPLHYQAHCSLAVSLLAAGQLRAADAQARRVGELFPRSPVPPAVAGLVALLAADTDDHNPARALLGAGGPVSRGRRAVADAAFRRCSALMGNQPEPTLAFTYQLADMLDAADRITVGMDGKMTVPEGFTDAFGDLARATLAPAKSFALMVPTGHLAVGWLRDIFALRVIPANKSLVELLEDYDRQEARAAGELDALAVGLLALNRFTVAAKYTLEPKGGAEFAAHMRQAGDLFHRAAETPTLIERSGYNYLCRCTGTMADVVRLRSDPDPPREVVQRLREGLGRMVTDGRADTRRLTREQGLTFVVVILTTPMPDGSQDGWKADTPNGAERLKKREAELARWVSDTLDQWELEEPGNRTIARLRKQLPPPPAKPDEKK